MCELLEAAATGTAMNTPLAATHLAAGAKMGVWFGCALPDYFGDPAAEYRSARETGADRQELPCLSLLHRAGPHALPERDSDQQHQGSAPWPRHHFAVAQSAGAHSGRD